MFDLQLLLKCILFEIVQNAIFLKIKKIVKNI